MMLLLFFMTVWPWFWVHTGLFVVRDFRITIALYELLCCILPVFLLRAEKTPLLPVRMPATWLLPAIIAANLFFLGSFYGTGGFFVDWPHFAQHSQTIHLADSWEFWLYGLYIIIFNPLFEESFWRGTVYRQWRAFLGPWPANLLSSFFFGAWHWLILQYYCEPIWALSCTAVVMLGGVMFAWSYEKTGTLGAAVIMHGLGADLPLVIMIHSALLQSAPLA